MYFRYTISMLKEEIESLVVSTPSDEKTKKDFLSQLQKGKLTRDEGSGAHFCVYFLPYNPKKKEVFIVHHKKSGLWLSPGGHIDANDTSLQFTLNREIEEELGLKEFFKENPKPFLLTMVDISRLNQPCSRHLDLWYLVETDGSNFNVDPVEFHDYKWMTFNEADEMVTDEANRTALEFIQSNR